MIVNFKSGIPVNVVMKWTGQVRLQTSVEARPKIMHSLNEMNVMYSEMVVEDELRPNGSAEW